MDNCIFCKVVENRLPSLKVYESTDAVSFMELNPSAPGHVMVILKKHGKSILDHNEKELGILMSAVSIVAQKLTKALNCDSITIGINHLEKRGVPHLHVHLIPRWESDKGGIIQSTVRNTSSQSREEIAEKIKKA